MVKQKHKLVSFATIVDLWDTCSLSSAISYISEAETLTPFLAAMLRKRSYFCQKSFVPGLECSNGKIFILDYRDLGRKNRDLVNRASAVSHVTTSKLLRRKKWRGDISETEPARLENVQSPSIETSARAKREMIRGEGWLVNEKKVLSEVKL